MQRGETATGYPPFPDEGEEMYNAGCTNTGALRVEFISGLLDYREQDKVPEGKEYCCARGMDMHPASLSTAACDALYNLLYYRRQSLKIIQNTARAPGRVGSRKRKKSN
jgi:hypothetical protein